MENQCKEAFRGHLFGECNKTGVAPQSAYPVRDPPMNSATNSSGSHYLFRHSVQMAR